MHHLMEMILSGEFKPGDKIHSERELIQIFNISRPVLRESLRALAAMGIIEVRHGDGMYVTTLEPDILLKPFDFLLRRNNDNITAVFEARKILEVGIIGLSAKNIDDETVMKLMDCLKKDEHYINDEKKFMENDSVFHAIIASSSKNKILCLLMQVFECLIDQSRSITNQSEEVRKQTFEHHKKIVKALKNRDVAASQSAMLEHLNNLEEHLIRE